MIFDKPPERVRERMTIRGAVALAAGNEQIAEDIEFGRKVAALPDQERAAMLAQLRAVAPKAAEDLARAHAQRKTLSEAHSEYAAWAATAFESPRLERNHETRVHQLLDASKAFRFVDQRGAARSIVEGWLEQATEHTFVMRHDWAAAFRDAEGFDGEWFLPFDYCCFEFRICGRTVFAMALPRGEMADDENDTENGFLIAIQVGEFWFVPQHDISRWESGPLATLIRSQIRAACIALEAEIAIATVVRVPEPLNRKRSAKGRTRLVDHHIIDLARRHRVEPGTEVKTGRSVRLHFRRGHWRHYESHKTWIRWTLVGNPDLGFVDSHYAL